MAWVLLDPFKTPVPFGGKSLGIRQICPQIGTAVLKVLMGLDDVAVLIL